MEIYIIRQIKETVEENKLKNVQTKLYGAYKDKNTIKKKAREISKQIAQKENLRFLESYLNDEKEPFTKYDCAVLYKGDDVSWWIRYFIEIISMELD